MTMAKEANETDSGISLSPSGSNENEIAEKKDHIDHNGAKKEESSDDEYGKRLNNNNYNFNQVKFRQICIRQLCIYGLSSSTTEDDLVTHFGQWGEVDNFAVFKTQREGACVGFITYVDPACIDIAQANRPHVIKERNVITRRQVPRVDFRSPEALITTKRILLSGMGESTTEEHIQQYLCQFGNIELVTVLRVPVSPTSGAGESGAQQLQLQRCFISFNDYDPVDKIALMPHHVINNTEVDIRKVLFLRGRVAREYKRKHQFPDDTVLLTDYDIKMMKENWDNILEMPVNINLQGCGDSNSSSAMAARKYYKGSYQNFERIYSSVAVFGEGFEASMYLSRQLNVAGLGNDVSEQSLANYFETWGEVESSVLFRDKNGKSKSTGFIVYKLAESVDKAQQWRPHMIDGEFVETRRQVRKDDVGNPEASLIVKRIYASFQDVEEEDLRTYFSNFGNIEDMVYYAATPGKINPKGGFAMIFFDDHDAVDKLYLMKYHIVNGKIVQVRKSYTPEDLNKHVQHVPFVKSNSMIKLIQSFQSFQ